MCLKIGTKILGVWPACKVFKMRTRESNYTTLLMATGLTFGTISALFGLQNKIITQAQYTVLVTVVILSAVIPTLIAQAFFEPDEDGAKAWRVAAVTRETQLQQEAAISDVIE
jgi:Kef-type K+ transport system membrane component KefB